MRQQFGENLAPNAERIQGLLLLVRSFPPSLSEDQKKGLPGNLVVSWAGIWLLSATFLSKCNGRFRLVRMR